MEVGLTDKAPHGLLWAFSGLWTAGHRQKVRTQARPSGMLAARVTGSRLRGIRLVQSRTYEITFVGQAGRVLRAEFDDCEVSVGPTTTTLRAELLDQGALHGLM